MEPSYPELKDRIQSTFIDSILIIFLMFVAANILDRFEKVQDWVRVAIFVGLFLVYEPLCMTFGSTAGNYFKRIRVRKNTDTTKKINPFQALIRYPVKVLLGWLSFLTINSNPKRRAIHDIVSGTVMIKL